MTCNDAEKYKAEDEAVAARITARNGIGLYVYDLCNSLRDDKLAHNFERAGRRVQTRLCKLLRRSRSSASCRSLEASKEEYDGQGKELEVIANRTMQELYGGAGSAPGGFLGGAPRQYI